MLGQRSCCRRGTTAATRGVLSWRALAAYGIATLLFTGIWLPIVCAADDSAPSVPVDGNRPARTPLVNPVLRNAQSLNPASDTQRGRSRPPRGIVQPVGLRLLPPQGRHNPVRPEIAPRSSDAPPVGESSDSPVTLADPIPSGPTSGRSNNELPIDLPAPSPAEDEFAPLPPVPRLPLRSSSEATRPGGRNSGGDTTGIIPRSSLPEAIPSASGDGDGWSALAPYQQRIDENGTEDLFDADVPPIPTTFSPWWLDEVASPIRAPDTAIKVELDSLILTAMQCAPQVLSLRSSQQIQDTFVVEELAEFDWHAFLDSRWNDLNDPVGNTLITGGPNRYKNQLETTTGGLRRKTETGGTFEASQQLGWQHTNSKFFVPPYQGQTRMQLSYTQPLLNGSGQVYNQSRIVLAQIDAEGSRDRALGELQDHLLKVTEAYWELYRSRVIFLQRRRNLGSAQQILDAISDRAALDAQQRQVLRARASVLRRRSDIARAEAAIRNAEARLRLLVNAPEMTTGPRRELVPLDFPQATCRSLPMSEALQTALIHRPDISAAIRLTRATGVKLCMAEKDLLPKLDLILSTYVAGLAGQGELGTSYSNQFNQGRPSYTAGVLYDMPLGNRAAKANLSRRELELHKAFADFRAAVETGLTETEIAVRDVQTSAREVITKYHSLVAFETETEFLTERWNALAGGDRTATRLLEDLLDSQERLADMEDEFVSAQIRYVLAMARVRHAMGTLLEIADESPLDTPLGDREVHEQAQSAARAMKKTDASAGGMKQVSHKTVSAPERGKRADESTANRSSTTADGSDESPSTPQRRATTVSTPWGRLWGK